jgi:hypothetical protein
MRAGATILTVCSLMSDGVRKAEVAICLVWWKDAGRKKAISKAATSPLLIPSHLHTIDKDALLISCPGNDVETVMRHT